MNISEIINQVGFVTKSHVSRAFKAKFAMPPSEYIKMKQY